MLLYYVGIIRMRRRRNNVVEEIMLEATMLLAFACSFSHSSQLEEVGQCTRKEPLRSDAGLPYSCEAK